MNSGKGKTLTKSDLTMRDIHLQFLISSNLSNKDRLEKLLLKATNDNRIDDARSIYTELKYANQHHLHLQDLHAVVKDLIRNHK